jgi:hypothetical protein
LPDSFRVDLWLKFSPERESTRALSLLFSFETGVFERRTSWLFFTERLSACGSLATSRKVRFFSILVLFAVRVFSTFSLLVLPVVERRCAFTGFEVAVITAARVIIVASSLNFIVFMTSYFKD